MDNNNNNNKNNDNNNNNNNNSNNSYGCVESFENLHTFILRQPCWWARERPQPVFQYNIIENFPTSFARNSVFVGSNDFKFGTETRSMVL